MNKNKINSIKNQIYGEHYANASKSYLAYKYKWDHCNINYLIKLLDLQGLDIVNDKPIYYSLLLKKVIICLIKELQLKNYYNKMNIYTLMSLI